MIDTPDKLRARERATEAAAIYNASAALRPAVQAAATIREYDMAFGELEIRRLVDALSDQVKLAAEGDPGRAEAMLIVHAHTLDAIFNNLARRAIGSEYMSQLERYLRLALRAQAQSRATWQAVFAIKRPQKLSYVHQADFAHGPQESASGEIEDSESKLLEKNHGERLDTRAPSSAIPANSPMAAVG